MGPQSKDRAKTTPAVMCIKILLQVFNLIYLIIGASVLGIGIWIQVQLKKYMQLTELYYDNAPWIMIGVGALILLVALGGFCCTAKDKVALLYMYGIFITVLAILQIAAGIAGAVFNQKIDTEITAGLHNTITKKEFRSSWDEVQQLLQCCGVDEPNDWINVTGAIPKSCFPSNSPSVATTASTNASSEVTTASAPPSTAATSPSTLTSEQASSTSKTEGSTTSMPAATITSEQATTTTVGPTAPAGRRKRQVTVPSAKSFTEGCHKKISKEISDYLSIIVGICVGFVLLQIIGAILACALAKKTSKNNYEQIY